MVRLFGYEIVMHTDNFTSINNKRVIKIHKDNNDTYVFIGRRMTIIVSKISKTSKGRRGVP